MPIIGVLAAGGLAPLAPTIGTATGGAASASITFTAPTWVGKGSGTVTYTATSSPSGITGTSTSSPVTVSGLTNGTAYTFTITATTSYGVTGPASAASNSVTPAAPLAFREIYTGEGRGTTVYYNDAVGGNWVTSGTAMPLGGALGSSSKMKPNFNRMYFWGNDGSPNNKCYSTDSGNSWRAEADTAANGDWAMGSYLNGSVYLIGVGGYTAGNVVNRATVNSSTGTLSWNNPSSYPVYASAPSVESLTSKLLVMGGFTDPSLSARRNTVYSTTSGASWTGETNLPFTPAGGYPTSASLIGATEARVYIANGATLYSRGDSSGTWRSETSLPAGNYAIGSGVYNPTTGNGVLQLAGAGGTFYQTVSASGTIPTLGAWTTNANVIGGDTSAYRGWITV
jgi:hypothetical protein